MRKMQLLAGTFALALAVSAALPQDAFARRMGGGRSFGGSRSHHSNAALKHMAAGFIGGTAAGILFGRGDGICLFDILLIGGGALGWYAWRCRQRRKEQEERDMLLRQKWSVQNNPQQNSRQDGWGMNGGGTPAGMDPAGPGAPSRPAWR